MVCQIAAVEEPCTRWGYRHETGEINLADVRQRAPRVNCHEPDTEEPEPPQDEQ